MSAGGALQQALVAALENVAGLAGVYDGPPARAAYPYVVLDASSENDWSHKTGEGREVIVAVTVWDDQPARMHALADAIEAVVAGVRQVSGWDLVTLRQMRRRVIRDVAGPWATAVDFRARLLAG
jgi:hypothetical protein